MLIRLHNTILSIIFISCLFAFPLPITGKMSDSPEVQIFLKELAQKKVENKTQNCFQTACKELNAFIEKYPVLPFFIFKAGSYYLTEKLLLKYAPHLKNRITYCQFLRCAPAEIIPPLSSVIVPHVAMMALLKRFNKPMIFQMVYETGKMSFGFTACQSVHTALEKYWQGYDRDNQYEKIRSSYLKTLVRVGTYMLSDSPNNDPVDGIVYTISDYAYDKMAQEFKVWQTKKN